MKEHLHFKALKDHPELVSTSVYKMAGSAQDVLVGEIDPQYMNGTALSDHYDVDVTEGINCIVVRGKREGEKVTAAILVPVGFRADLNRIVPERLEVKKVSMAPLEEVIEETGMEYGSITPIGLPDSWKILIDSRILLKETIIIGGGKQISKLRVPVAFLQQLPQVEVVEGLAKQIPEVSL